MSDGGGKLDSEGTPTRKPEPASASSPDAALDPTRTGTHTARAEENIRHRSEARASSASQREPERYVVLGEHGRGGLGRVYRARDLELGRDVAIKELLARSELSEIRFLREALITARLEHPGIVPVHEAGRWPDGTPFYAMKLVAGRPLRELIEQSATVELRISLLHHVIAVADAIAYAHDHHIIHRDLKPSNVIVGDFGETIVIDWGLAKDLSAGDDVVLVGEILGSGRLNDLTQEGTVVGTPSYMAPEQARGEQVDQRADVFAIGAMLWELCSLQRVPPLRLEARNRMLRRAGIDEDLAVIIDKCLAHDPSQRYRNAGELASDLKAFKAGTRITARAYSPVARLVHWTRRHRALAMTVAVGAVIALFGATFSYLRIARERDRADIKADEAALHAKQTEVARNDLLLQHAELLLTTDPTESFKVLETYRGGEPQRARMIRAHAKGLGIARAKASVHHGSVLFAHDLPD
ncbi:MAG TPA: serine/threonine-protein kinase, partial [Kofleriaceae bacterium]